MRDRTEKPITLNFFCHAPPGLNNAREAAGAIGLRRTTASWAIDPAAPVPSSNRAPFDAELCERGARA